MNDFLYGARAKLGLIYPAPGWVMEPEFYEMSPEGVITLTTRMGSGPVDTEQLSTLGDKALKSLELLKEAPIDGVIFGCTSGSFVGGVEYDKELIRKLEEASGGLPCTTTSRSCVEALNVLNVKKVAVATPYTDEVNEKAKEFLEKSGIEVTKLKGLNFLYDSEINRADLETVYNLAREVDTEDAEAVLILCTGIRSVPILETLETDLDKPVISAIQATFWNALRMCGVNEKIKGFGSLLERY
ncbi:maleate cis-trans isomerase family protein [Anaeromicrobium sediminis]|uniref:Asp/Glu racemase n=1 Tax=Anaeromicrobium sediminis TaxID=1478221 RepID=A0A267MI27_9FIRM|nr:aspartate/glutamate racemase family protein [Anaeromicrobium sediminis]PAB59229.1 Asp/Glu racemase [Anaeromicrobium sediminis]